MALKKGLGRGLESLLSVYGDEEEPKVEVKKTEVLTEVVKEVVRDVNEIEIDKIYANPNQPRKNFNEEALNELAESIKQHGVIQPLIVNKSDDGRYMIIAGERRFRASKIAGLSKVPCVIKEYTEREIKEVALIENLQREDLNPVEAARAIKQLMEEYNFTQDVVADRIGKSRPNVANLLRILKLTPEVLKLIENGALTTGHARTLVMIEDPTKQIAIANYAVDKKLNVRDIEKLVKNELKGKPLPKTKMEQSLELKEFVDEMKRLFSTKVSILGNDNKGRIFIDYYSRDDLDRIIELVNLIKAKNLTLADLNNYNKRNGN